MIDDGNNGDFIEANYDNDVAVRWKPSLSRLEITRLQLLSIGKTFRIKLKARNYAGEVESPILGVVLAGLPHAPPVPSSIAEMCNDTTIAIDISGFPLSSNGGCSIITFEVQQDNGRGGLFISKVGNQQPYLKRFYKATGLQKGLTYRFRYRAKNCQGWGPFSPELYVLAATVPHQPLALKVLSVSASSVQLQLFPTRDNGGAIVTTYKLYRNNGQDGSAVTECISYNFGVQGFIASINTASESMTAGLFYQFSYKALNQIGSSALSPVMLVPVADVPLAPSSVQVVEQTKTTIAVIWSAVAPTQGLAGTITGYTLFMDNGFNENYSVVFDGKGAPDIRSFKANHLQTGLPYKFYVTAANFIGSSPPSLVSTFYTCQRPSGLSPPTLS